MKKENEENEMEYEPAGMEDNFGAEPEMKIKKLKEELKECQKKAAEFLAGWQRAKADLINFRKDEEKNREIIVRYANADLINEILDVLDSFEKAAKEPFPDDKWKKGFERIKDQLMNILRKRGVEEIKSLGLKFNPAEHESIAEESAPKEKDQTVLEELRKGYKMNDKVLRPARVKIGFYKITDNQ
ncbi:MAG: nucleotide exchange factor GrpE [Candidatus Niyogibacteria bacterium]|nr:nucleotide exchange factor GrpE [Candidatus Niyogibacteria bacterium]